MNTYVHTKTYAQILIAVLFFVAKERKPPKCVSINEQINNISYIHSVEYYLSVRRNEVLIYAIMWMNLENIMLKEASHKKPGNV